MKKLENLAMTKKHPQYDQAIAREEPLYSREHDLRTPFGRDYTRIIFSLAYRRLKNKTQVFFAVNDDHVCTRNEHVNLVESIAHTLATELGLNTELTRAIAVGHDLGHAPFGHGGEKIITAIAKDHGLASFWHEKNSLHFVDEIELLEDNDHHEHNLNLCYAVRDGIIAHCGEMRQHLITPRKEAIDLSEYTHPGEYEPFTYEGCVVKISDKIAYLARDIEDALRLRIITEEEVNTLKEELNKRGGYQFNAINNGSVVNYFIHDVIDHSSQEGIGLSDEAFEKMHKIMDFNYRHIYEIKRVRVHSEYVRLILNSIFDFLYDYGKKESFIQDLKRDQDQYHKLITHYLAWLKKYALIQGLERDSQYENKIVYDFSSDPQALEKSILDYLAGMSDQFILQAFNELISF